MSTQALAGSAACYAPGMVEFDDEDTVEWHLSATEVAVLANAAERGERDLDVASPIIASAITAPVMTSPAIVPPAQTAGGEPAEAAVTPAMGTKRAGSWLRVAAACGAVLLALSITIAYQLGLRAQATAPAIGGELAELPAPAEHAPVQPAAAVEQASAPVRFPNPFDRSEVFEFPPGTTVAEARENVASLLLQRAQQRTSSGRVVPATGGPQERPGLRGTAR